MDTGSPCFQDIPLSTEINTSCASALSPISHFFFHSALKDLATVQCCEENWMNNLPWETNNIMDPECLLSVMGPNRRLDRRKWCVVLCWDNSPGPPQTTAAEIWSVHKPQVFWILEGPRGKRKLAEQGKWVTPRSEWGCWETLKYHMCACVGSVTLSTHTNRKSTHFKASTNSRHTWNEV